ncbi:MAG: AbrB/MazE/SpoVT family DNA-binding domain-containing protein [Chlorobiaceae bacterium]|nr:AbrB/MazE/SpoVT family DNA-binding domain-containing protein [Chlorobiaceae bacterium]
MEQIRVRKRLQITIPWRIAELAHIKPDDMLEVSFNNGVVTLIPVSRKIRNDSPMTYAGIARGIWGKTTQEIEAEHQKAHESWQL